MESQQPIGAKGWEGQGTGSFLAPSQRNSSDILILVQYETFYTLGFGTTGSYLLFPGESGTLLLFAVCYGYNTVGNIHVDLQETQFENHCLSWFAPQTAHFQCLVFPLNIFRYNRE